MALHDVCFSKDRSYRYWLEAQLSGNPDKVCLFLMLNPSTATEDASDQTLTKCKRFAGQWGYGTLRVVNLFAFRTSDPEDLGHVDDPVGKTILCGRCQADNDWHVITAALGADKIVLAWGTSGYKAGDALFLDRVKHVVTTLVNEGWTEKLHRLNNFSIDRGQPRHPMGRGQHYLSLNTPCVQFTNEELKNFMRHGIARPNR